MLQSLPALLDELERRLVQGEDPTPLLTGLRWTELMEWPESREAAFTLKRRLQGLATLTRGLEMPIRAAVAEASKEHGYNQRGSIPEPKLLLRFAENV